MTESPATATLWHDLECGPYDADLPLWRRLAAEEGGPVLDLGAGTGRVALDLARAGFDVVALDLEQEFLCALRARADADPAGIGARITTIVGDAREFALPDRRFPLILAPMQTVQLLGGSAGRGAFLRSVAAHLAPGGLLAAALADALEGFDAEHTEPPLPDIVELDGWVHVSQPVAVRPGPEGIAIERIRQSVSPDGRRFAEGDSIHLDALTADQLTAEGVAAGLRDGGRTRIEATEEHVGSEVVLLRG
ncbi:class I SAM-dependent methyltransferase [Conexibacter sp. JD483]|uniref:class I SAM-dependent methyltransferase n=1 Tax=unclassified Conexibacter TaxID=2627773 RepID=UPI0027169E6B|nr:MULTISPECIES: class I SAM-dependent methyltransferase [unclassified Conexibacter]MDO8185333.1 class I SAM-dependent methyltransferase [Conexibacter sp. CPCC 205706]MDO8198491.1 class I SAM-dependent methyltransferase [Conexibacter sp. CPCC 205762]MDR9368744.1 class I SAM-dependent methyltransferase [Conexibacter sp. JD483]